MKFSYIARQPILDATKSLVGYELLFRDGPSNKFPDVEPELATSRLISDHFFSAHNLSSESALSFINFPYESLVNKLPTLLPKDRIVIEILEDCEATPELLEAVKIMHKRGYKLALDDFIPHNRWKPFLPYIHYIKFDIRSVPIPEAAKVIKRLTAFPIKYLAEKVETHEEFNQAQQAGFTYFQGYFFAKPEMDIKRSIDPTVLTVVQLCQEIAKPDMDFIRIEQLISRDVGLSYKLLSIVNGSPNVLTEIHSFKQAIVYLGEKRLRKFISLLAIAAVGENKPQYLFGLSLQTARFCELVSRETQLKVDPGTPFLTGMFVYLDSLLDHPIETLLAQIPIDKNVKAALISQQGELGMLVTLAKSYEKANWRVISSIAETLQLDTKAISTCYAEAIKWTSELFSQQPED